MSKILTEQTRFDFIRYANCWEDPDILLKGLDPPEDAKILSIGSAGDNSFSLLTCNPDLVIAADINPAQLHLIELKKAAITLFDQADTLKFLGFAECNQRTESFHKLKELLSEDAGKFWEMNLASIHNGVIHSGKFEKYFQTFVRYVLPLIHSKKTVKKLLEPKSSEEQEIFYTQKLNTVRWRFLFKFFFSKTVMGYLGRDPNFLKEVKVDVGSFIFAKAARQLRSKSAQDNFILHYNLSASFGPTLPHYLRPENYSIIKANLDKLRLFHGFAEEALDAFGPVNSMNLSNIFEYMDDKTFQTCSEKLTKGLLPGGRMAYWNLMVPRKISEVQAGKLQYLTELSHTLTNEDKGFFYDQFIVDQLL